MALGKVYLYMAGLLYYMTGDKAYLHGSWQGSPIYG